MSTHTAVVVSNCCSLPSAGCAGLHRCHVGSVAARVASSCTAAARWGYGGHDDLMALDGMFTKLGIPCDGLWLDLDYMDGFRIFTVDKAMFPEGTQPTADLLAKSGRRMVPILDPGLKLDPGYAQYDEAKAADLLCHNPEGGEYVGLVWPGETVFPDFSLPEARDWWSAQVSE